jgi:hypothetical protein
MSVLGPKSGCHESGFYGFPQPLEPVNCVKLGLEPRITQVVGGIVKLRNRPNFVSYSEHWEPQ